MQWSKILTQASAKFSLQQVLNARVQKIALNFKHYNCLIKNVKFSENSSIHFHSNLIKLYMVEFFFKKHFFTFAQCTKRWQFLIVFFVNKTLDPLGIKAIHRSKQIFLWRKSTCNARHFNFLNNMSQVYIHFFLIYCWISKFKNEIHKWFIVQACIHV